MATSLKVLTQVPIYTDASYSSPQAGTYEEGAIVNYSEQAGSWFRTGFGWISMYGSNNSYTNALELIQTETTDKKVGNIVTINTNNMNIKDMNGNTLQPGTYSIIQIKANTVVIKDALGHTFEVRKELIATTTTTGIVAIPADVASATDYRYVRKDTVGGNVDTLVDNIITGDWDNTPTALWNVLTGIGDAISDGADKIIDGIPKWLQDPTNLRQVMTQSTMKGVYGAPYQYLPIVDPREGDGNTIDIETLGKFGTVFADKIASRMPILVMIPGSAQFLPGANKDDASAVFQALTDADVPLLESIATRPIKYFGLRPDWDKYFDYVDVMCNAAASMLNLSEKPKFQNGIANYQWNSELNENVQKLFLTYRGGVVFYMNAEPTISESFTNSTGQSALLSKVGNLSEIGREINFIAGGIGGNTIGKLADTFIPGEGAGNGMSVADFQQRIAEQFGSFAGGGAGVGGILGEVLSGASTLIAGGHLMFPDIWQDSQYSRDLNISIKLVSPDNDKYSLYMNIIVPLLHLIAFTAPHNVDVNGYISPFLVRLFYKGMFNCDMGIVNSLSITKGGEGNWNNDGIPTVVEVNMNIKELYSQFSISNTTGDSTFYDNLQLMDYVGNLCGINIAEPCWERKMALWNLSKGPQSYIDDIFGIPRSIENAWANLRLRWASNSMISSYILSR